MTLARPAGGRGRFITLEGGEGAGKTTQAGLLAARLRERGLEVVATREPGGSPGAERLRTLLLSGEAGFAAEAEAAVHFAARVDHVAALIAPSLEAGSWVVCDRFSDSTMAYQGFGLGADRAWLARLADLVGLRPDLTLVLDVSDAASDDRVRQRGMRPDRYEQLGPDFHARVRAGFRSIAEAEADRCRLIPAGGAVTEVQQRIWQAVIERVDGT